jgi:hypothetical protein
MAHRNEHQMNGIGSGMTLLRLAVAAGLLLLAACDTDRFDFLGNGPARERAGGTWVKPDTGADRRDVDMRECRRTAAAQIERDRRIDEDTADRNAGAGASQGTEDLMRSMEVYGYEQRRERLFARCMQGRGYRRE